MSTVARRLEQSILDLLEARGPAKSICPSEAARAVGDEGWHDLMEPAREVARELAVQGRVVVTSGEKVLSPDEEWRGPVRIRWP
ncbi:DUF3253 domain-containing protein [Lentzea sp. NPDC058436]|uniref:DUF3253 domain-containing protein n=1 Tax=Lentzea sp. NPDC058436 TaxID=3346499 RepID=UPI003651F08D